MSVLIEGMEMPKNCEIIIRIDEKGEVYVYGQYPTRIYKAIPVTPHGRLIDADELIDDVRRHSESYFADDFAHEWVDKAPTVIPADNQGGDVK